MPDIPKIRDLPALNEDQVDDALFRIRDRLWASLGDLFVQRSEDEGLSYADVARRIGRKRSQVQRWLATPHNMTVSSAGLLAEGLDADLTIGVKPRPASIVVGNYVHPCEDAREFVCALSLTHPEPEIASPSTKTEAKPANVTSDWRMVHAH